MQEASDLARLRSAEKYEIRALNSATSVVATHALWLFKKNLCTPLQLHNSECSADTRGVNAVVNANAEALSFQKTLLNSAALRADCLVSYGHCP